MYKFLIICASLALALSCNHANEKHVVSTIDSQTIATPLPNQVLSDTDNHNVGKTSEVALDSPVGKRNIDTAGY